MQTNVPYCNTISALNLKQQSRYNNAQNLGHTLDLTIKENSEEYQVDKIIPGPYISGNQFISNAGNWAQAQNTTNTHQAQENTQMI